jgi:hypothetical protein
VPSARKSAPRIYDLMVTLSDVEPVVWRRLRMSSGATLGRVHRVIAVAFGWPLGRPYAFESGDLRYEGRLLASGAFDDVVDVRLRQLLHDPGGELEIEYGDEPPWHLVMRLERVHAPNEDARVPLCLDGEGASPPIDAGGPWAYEELRSSRPDDGRHGSWDTAESPASTPDEPPRPFFNADVVNAELDRLQ